MIFTGSRGAAEVPDLPLTDFVLQNAARHPDRLAVVDVTGAVAYTYAELASAIRQAAASLQARGFGKGDVLAILAPNIPQYPIALHAAAAAGGTAVLLNPLDTVDELVPLINDAGVKLLVTVPAEMTKAAALLDRTGLAELIVIGGTAEGATSFADLLTGATPEDPGICPPRDVAALVHSSGSTGSPKGVMLTHRNIVAAVVQTDRVAPAGEHERVLAMPPFHHAFGLIMVMNAGLLQGATLVTMPRFDPEAYLRAIEEHRVTRLFIVPTIAVLLARSPLVDRYDLSSLESIISGGATLKPEIAERVRERIGCEIGQGYGMTEAMNSFMQRTRPRSPASVGENSPNVECRIVDIRTGAELGPNEQGEILIRGPHVMKGYHRAAEATRQALDPDGFLHTGDLGYVDENGELFVVDRIKELIKYKGQQVSPVELEAVLMSHPKVLDAAVVGVADEDAGELPKGFVVMAAPATPEEIMTFVAERVAPYKKIRRLEFVDLIPRTAVGKIERRSLKERPEAAVA